MISLAALNPINSPHPLKDTSKYNYKFQIVSKGKVQRYNRSVLSQKPVHSQQNWDGYNLKTIMEFDKKSSYAYKMKEALAYYYV